MKTRSLYYLLGHNCCLVGSLFGRVCELRNLSVNQALAHGVLTRAVQHTRPPHLLPHAVVQLQYEMSVDGMTSGVLKQASRAVALSKTCEKNKKASKVLGKFGTG